MNALFALYGAVFGIAFPWTFTGILSFITMSNAYKIIGLSLLFRVSVITGIMFAIISPIIFVRG